VFLNLFIASMMILVAGDYYLMLFVGWEGVGLCSFLLIGFWYEMDTLGRPSWANSDAAKKAMIANRIGDFGFLIAAFLMFTAFGSLQFDEVFAGAMSISSINSPLVVLITLFLLLGVTGKSAQIPLYVWLPDAMAGPTPVSALIHAATMVTAGVYLVARSAPLYVAAPAAQLVVATVGAVTALFAATIAVGQFDIKKVLAYSTISQLGFMVAGVHGHCRGMFHLVTHAFFKALLFLSAGSIILGLERGHHHLAHAHGNNHARKDTEVFDPNDMRNMGGMRKSMPVTFWLYITGTLALAGIRHSPIWVQGRDPGRQLRRPAAHWLLTPRVLHGLLHGAADLAGVLWKGPARGGGQGRRESRHHHGAARRAGCVVDPGRGTEPARAAYADQLAGTHHRVRSPGGVPAQCGAALHWVGADRDPAILAALRPPPTAERAGRSAAAILGPITGMNRGGPP
jgi:hypothetical protein